MVKKRKDQCDKCKNPLVGGSAMASNGRLYYFCKLCTILIDKLPSGVIEGFIKGRIKLGKIDQDMLEARINRGKGEKVWD